MNKLIFYIISLSVICLPGCNRSPKKYSCVEIADNYRGLFDKFGAGLSLYEKSKEFKDVLANSNKCVYSCLLIGDIYLQINNLDSAKRYFLKAIDIEPAQVYPLFNLGLIYSDQHKYDSAIVYFRAAEATKNQDGFVLEKNNNLKKITGRPSFDIDYLDIVYNMALSNYQLKEYFSAKRELDYCISFKKNLNEAFFYRGLINLMLKEKNKFCEDMENAKENGNVRADSCIKIYCLDKSYSVIN